RGFVMGGFGFLRRRETHELAENALHRIVKSWSKTETVLRGQHYQPQLRHGTTLRLEVDRLDKQQRRADWDNQQMSSQHMRSLLVPESKLRGQLRVLIDARFNL